MYIPVRLGAPLLPHLGASLALVELGHVDSTLAIGFGAPSVELGVTSLFDGDASLSRCRELIIWPAVHAHSRPRYQLKQESLGLTLTTGAEYDVRATPQPNELLWTLTLGIAKVTRLGPCEERAPCPGPLGCGATAAPPWGD
ncbi:hypothetical protein [Sorangium sp. So ce131]|uniref:hypothetical protein n=1 Tax=Sorangium sp. So ce131 TaxID=3133282 RepID=UPI003F62C6B6